jgi:phosphoribosylformylglycinamidine synthase
MAVAIAEMGIGSGLGAEIDLRGIEGETFVKLFSESNTRWIVEVKEEDLEDYISFMLSKGCKAYGIGVVSKRDLSFNDRDFNLEMDIDSAERLWRNGLVRFTGW